MEWSEVKFGHATADIIGNWRTLRYEGSKHAGGLGEWARMGGEARTPSLFLPVRK
jgi:hypothetical protein